MDSILKGHYKIYSFVLIILIYKATGTESNGTSHERRQSRVTGRIVKLYSGTRPEPAVCAGEGFQADPHNCAVFYRCMKSSSGKYTVFRFQCGPGTVYDPETEVCNHPRSTKRSECGGISPPLGVDRINNNEIEGTQDEIPSPITNQPTYTIKPPHVDRTIETNARVTTVKSWVTSSSTLNTSTKRHIPEVSAIYTSSVHPWGSSSDQTYAHSTINPFYSHQPTVTQKPQPKITSSPNTSIIPQSNPRDNICNSDGFMGDTENCRKFYRCVASQRGTYTRYEFMCSESTVWDDASQSCNHGWAVKRSRCGRSNQDNQNVPPTTENTQNLQNEQSKDKTIQQQLQISFGSQVTQTQTQISNGSVIQNQIQINYGDRIKPNKNTEAKQHQTQISHESAISQTQTQIDYSDKGVQTQLQIDHSQQSSQTQIQIHESTTLRGLSSIDSSTSHAGTQGNKCTKSGFMGDANDCKKFYRCIDNGRGGYTKFEFSCGEGTVWDQSIEACNHAWAVKECGNKVSTETTSTTDTPISTSKSTQNYFTTVSTENYYTTSGPVVTEDNEDGGYGHQNQGSTTTSTTSRPSTTKLPSSTECQSSGFVGDANDCKVFYRCVENGRGSFTKYEFKCGEGTVWDPDLEACNHAWAVKNCGGNASPDINKIETTTKKQNTPSHTQSTIVIQSTTASAATQIDDYDTGYGSENNVFTSTTTTKQPQAVDHSKDKGCQSSGFMGDDKDCKKFYRCVDNGNGGYTRYEFACGEGTVWDPKIDACNHAWAVEKCGGSGSTVDHQESTTQPKPTTSHEIVDSSSTENQNTSSSTAIPSTIYSTSTMSTTKESVFTGSTCTRSGFMGDQNDCKKFYRCVDNGKGSYTKYEFSCGEGTVWDQKIEACNHAWAVEKCGGTAESTIDHHESTTQYRPTMSDDEIDDGYPSIINPGPDITTQRTTTYSTTDSSIEPSDGSNCIVSGFIGDKNDCKKFYRCVDDGKGGFIRYEFSCGEGTLWDQSIEACNHAWAVKDCGKTGINTVHTSSESPTQATLISDSEDQGYPQFTENTSTSTISNYPDNSISEMCSKEGFVGDRNDCKKFYRCVDNGRGGFTKYEFTCGEGTYWNQEILSCDHATPNTICGGTGSTSSLHIPQHENDEIYTEATSTLTSSSTVVYENEYATQKPQVSSGACTSEGFYGNPNNCKMFYRCVDNGKSSYTKYDFTCGEGTVWDQEIQACNHESSNKKCLSSSPPNTSQTTENQHVYESGISTTTASQIQHSTEKTETSSASSSYQCTSEGFFAYPNDCKKFIRCVSNDKGGYTKYEFACGEGTIWVQDILACDHDSGDAYCSSQTTSIPHTTEGHQQTTEKYAPGTSTSQIQTIDKQDDEYDNGYSDRPSHSGNTDCSSVGFYGNENDCRQFYRCVDNGKGGYTKYDFTCGEGTAWDSDIQACNHIDQVKTCHGASETHPVMHDEDSPPTESSSTMKTTTSQSNYDTSSGNKNKCDNEGYYGDTQDCKKFYRCVDNGKGGYTKYDYTCGEGTIWDQDITTCNHPQDVTNPSCNQNQDGNAATATSAPPNESSSSTTSTTVTSSSTSDSSSSFQTTTTTTEKTQIASNCSQEETSKKPVNQNVTCDKAGYYANPNDCKKFYRCVDWDGDGKRFSVYHFECGEGTIWDPAVETCNHEESVYPPRDCSGSQSQSENQPPATEETTTTQQQTSPTTQSTTESTTQTTNFQPTTTQQSTTSEQTTTQQSTTSKPTTTQQSTTSEQTTTQKSTTSVPTTTQQSTTSEKTTTQQSTTSEQTTTQQSTTEQTTTQQSTTSEQTTQQSTTSEQTTQQSTTSEQTTQQSTTSEQTTTQQSTISEPTTTQQSTTSEPTTTEQSTTQQSTTEQSTTSEQTTTDSSTTSESTTEQSSSTTESSTTEQSTLSTSSSTTTETSEQSTTESTSTDGTTTEESTVEQSTTEQTNESSTTESSTDETDKKCPETNEDQNLFVCPTSFRRHPKYCNLFYQCDEDDNTHDIKIAVFTCPNNTIYDESQTRCVEANKADKKCDGKIAQNRRFKRLDNNYKEPIVVTKDSHACPSAGYFSFEKDSECSPAFLKCKTDKTKKLRGLVYQCPTGYVYWSISKRCEPENRVRDCKRTQNNWSGRWEIPVERRNVAASS